MGPVEAAVKALRAGIRPIPIVKGSKVAAIKWDGQDAAMPAEAILRLEFGGDFWIAAQAGRISGGIECVDFDDPECYAPWLDILGAFGLTEVAGSCYVQQTPKGGYHVVYRCEEPDGNLKLAYKHTDDGKRVRIETRGEGGYFLIAPSPDYKPLQGSLSKLPVLSAHQRRMLLDAAKTFDLAPKKPYVTGGPEGVVKPGKDYDSKHSWADVLEPAGWKLGHTRGGESYWVRPGKKVSEGISATTGYAGTDLLKIFSSNACPFEEGCTYSKFAAYAFLHHGGNFIEAARDLGKRGYGDQARPMAQVKYEPAPKDAPMAGDWLDEVEPETPEFLLGSSRYLLKRQLNLLDGKGGTNKSTLLLAIAAMGSRGTTPFGGACEPFKTLYFTQEDSAGAYAGILRKLGGCAPKCVKLVGKGIPKLDRDGCREIAKMASGDGFGFVVFDPIINLMAGVVRNVLDRMEVGPVLERLRESVCYETGAGVGDVRHEAMGANGRELDDRGAGSRVWPDTHRSQLVVLSPEGKDHRRYVFHAKASMLVERDEPFAYGWRGSEFCFWTPTVEELAESVGYTPEGQKVKGDKYRVTDAEVRSFFDNALGQEWRLSEDVRLEAKAKGLDPFSGTFKRVQREVADYKREGFGSGAVYHWRKKDPFADDGPKPWAGCE